MSPGSSLEGLYYQGDKGQKKNRISFRPLDKSVYLKIMFHISQPKTYIVGNKICEKLRSTTHLLVGLY